MDGLLCALVGNVRILYLSINLTSSKILEDKQLKIGKNFPDNPNFAEQTISKNAWVENIMTNPEVPYAESADNFWHTLVKGYF